MRRALTILGLLAVATLMAFTVPPRPRVGSVGARFTVAPDSTVTAALTLYMTGQFRVGDAIRYKVLKDDTVKVNTVVAATTFTATGIPAPAYGATSVYKATAQLVVGGVNTGPIVTSAPWSYARPGLPAPVLDSLIIKPASWSMGVGTSKQACAIFAYTPRSASVLAAGQETIAFCQDVLAAFVMGA